MEIEYEMAVWGGGGGGGGRRMANFHQLNNTAFQIFANLAFNFYTHFLFQVQPGAIFQSHFSDFAFKTSLYRFNPE